MLAWLSFIFVAAVAGAAPITGTVTDAATRRPLSGMVVAAYDAAGALAATGTTDPTGLYALSVPTGSYRVLAYDPNGVYATTFDANADSFETAPLRNIGAAGAVIDFALVTGGTITGRVEGPFGGEPEAVVEAYNLSGTRRAFTMTNGSGDFSLVLPPGEYKLVAYDATGSLAPSFYRDARGFAEATVVRVHVSAVTNVTFSLPMAARVSGTIRDAQSNAPIAGMLVYAYTADGVLVATTTSTLAGSGFYRFSLPAGSYRIVAADPTRTYATAFYDGSRSFEGGTVLTVGAGQQRSDVTVRMVRGVAISGRANAPGLTVAAYNADGTLHVSTTTDAAGDYTLLVAPGEYRIAFSDPALAYVTQFYGGSPDFNGATRVFAVADDIRNLNVTLQRGGRFTGVVRDALTNQPLAGININAYDAAGLLAASAVTGADGRYTIVVAPGAYRILGSDPQLNLATSYAGGATSFEATIPLNVAVDGLVLADLTMRRGVRVTGFVSDQHGTPIHGAEVFALDALGNRVAGGMTNAGAFTVVVVPGTYRFVASGARYAARYFPNAGTFDEAQWVVVGGQGPVLTFTLQGSSRRRAVRA